MKKLKVLMFANEYRDASSKNCEFAQYLDTVFDVVVRVLRTPRHASQLRILLISLLATIRELPIINNYDILYSANLSNAVWFAMAQSIFGKKIFRCKHVVLDVGSTKYLCGAQNALVWVFKKVFSSVDVVLCVSKSNLVFWRDIASDATLCSFVPLMIENEYHKAQPIAGNYIVSAGGCDRDFSTMLDALKRLNYDAVIITDKKNYSEIEGRIKGDLSVRCYVDIPRSEYIRYIYGSMFVVLPLKAIGYHPGQMVLLQSMAMGKAVIASRTNGTVDYIVDGATGIFVEAEDPGGLADAIRKLAENPGLSRDIGLEAQKFVVESCLPKAFAAKLSEVFRGLFL